jgi:hypothetical protein
VQVVTNWFVSQKVEKSIASFLSIFQPIHRNRKWHYYQMGFGYYQTLQKYLHRYYYHSYTEKTGAVGEWYKSLTLPERKQIKIQGPSLDNEFYPDDIYTD